MVVETTIITPDTTILIEQFQVKGIDDDDLLVAIHSFSMLQKSEYCVNLSLV